MKAHMISDSAWALHADASTDDLFEGIWPIKDGVSLNSYLVKGEKTALIDLVRDWVEAPRALKARVRVREVGPDIALAVRPEQGVDDGVDERVAVGVAQEAGPEGDVDAPEDEPAAGLEAVDVIAQADLMHRGAPPRGGCRRGS